MVDAVNTVGGGTPVAPVGQQPVRAPSPGGDAANAAKTLNTGSVAQPALLSSRLYVDSTAGGILVSEQVNPDGSIAQQTPSSSVLAYLQNGLTIEGYPKQSTTA